MNPETGEALEHYYHQVAAALQQSIPEEWDKAWMECKVIPEEAFGQFTAGYTTPSGEKKRMHIKTLLPEGNLVEVIGEIQKWTTPAGESRWQEARFEIDAQGQFKMDFYHEDPPLWLRGLHWFYSHRRGILVGMSLMSLLWVGVSICERQSARQQFQTKQDKYQGAKSALKIFLKRFQPLKDTEKILYLQKLTPPMSLPKYDRSLLSQPLIESHVSNIISGRSVVVRGTFKGVVSPGETDSLSFLVQKEPEAPWKVVRILP